MNGAWRGTVGILALALLAGCGGSSETNDQLPADPNGFVPGVFQPSSTFANLCETPRTGTNPATNLPFPDQQGSYLDQNNFLRSWTNETYLWYDEVLDLNPAHYSTLEYFSLLRTQGETPSGQPKDRFHFTYDSEAWQQLSQSGIEPGYGAQWVLVQPNPPRRIVVAYVEPGSPAAVAGLQRGDEVTAVDGVDAVDSAAAASLQTVNIGLFPADAGEEHTFTILGLDGTPREVSMTSDNVVHTPVQNVTTLPTDLGPIGYLVFNDHIATAEGQLIDAIAALDAASITDLVLDIRYNGGGYLDIASQLAYMIAGSVPTAGQVFERITFNDKHPSTNPITGGALTPTPFHTATMDYSEPAGTTLPTLDLPRVYVLTGSATCSASEAIINGLRGVGVEVFQIGTTTCGKPYGFYAQDNCGITFFSIQFRGENALGFGDYSDGFSPNNVTSGVGELVSGCEVADDFDHALGDPAEARLAAALSFRASGNQTCPAASSFAPDALLKPGQSLSDRDGLMFKSPWRENRILRDM